MSRDNIYVLLGIAVFVAAFVVLFLFTDLSLIMICIAAILISLVSDVLIVVDNEMRNAAPDAKFHHRNELVGEVALVVDGFRPEGDMIKGKIEVKGEKWNACSHETELNPGDQVRLIDRNEMTFTVEKISINGG